MSAIFSKPNFFIFLKNIKFLLVKEKLVENCQPMVASPPVQFGNGLQPMTQFPPMAPALEGVVRSLASKSNLPLIFFVKADC